MPVRGLSSPIFTEPAARARSTNGLATCAAPRTSPAFKKLRRPSGPSTFVMVTVTSLFLAREPRLICAADNLL